MASDSKFADWVQKLLIPANLKLVSNCFILSKYSSNNSEETWKHS